MRETVAQAYQLIDRCPQLAARRQSYSDSPASRKAVLTTINRLEGPRRFDPRLFTPVECELIECYRNMSVEDRALLRLILRRMGVQGLPELTRGGD